MNGVAMPSVSPGSSHRDGSVTCTPKVRVPSGAAAAGPARPSTSAATTITKHEVDDLMDASQGQGGGSFSQRRPFVDGRSLVAELLRGALSRRFGDLAVEAGEDRA